MEMVQTIAWQVLTMLVLAMVGCLMFRAGKITQEGSKALGNILIYLSLPCVIINSFLVERTPEKLCGFLISAALAAVLLGLSILIARLILGRHAIDNFAGSFSNPGFFGIPLIVASLGEDGVFYIAAFVAFLNLGQWTYGVSLLQGSDENGLLTKKPKRAASPIHQIAALAKRLIQAPFMIAILVGLFFFLTGIPMPDIPARCIGYVAGLNTPIAMFTIGIYMARVDIGKMLRKPRLYLVAAVRMLIIPAAALAVLLLLPGARNDLKMALLIAAACPVGSNVAVYAQLHNKDYPYAVETVIISTLFSIITMPVIVGIANVLLQYS